MRRWIAVAVGGVGLGALLRRRRSVPSAQLETHVEELREKLAQSRAAGAAEPEVPAANDVDGRRRDLHERTRRAIDDLS